MLSVLAVLMRILMMPVLRARRFTMMSMVTARAVTMTHTAAAVTVVVPTSSRHLMVKATSYTW